MMPSNISYITNTKGKPTAVIVNLKDWQNLQKELDRLKQQEALRGQIERGLTEVRLWKQGKKKLMSLDKFIEDEL